MEPGELLELPVSLPGKIEANEIYNDDLEPGEVTPVESSREDTKEKSLGSHNQGVLAPGNGGTLLTVDAEFHGDLVVDAVDIDMDVDPHESLRLLDKLDVGGVGLTSANVALSLDIMNGAAEEATCSIPTSSQKRARIEHDVADQPSVHIAYKFLNSSSRQKLEELLKQWSEWHARHCSSSLGTTEEVLSGEETFFPALQINVGKPFALSFWLDQQTVRMENEEVVSFDAKTVPLYDRGYSLGLNTENHSSNFEGLEIVDDVARCFNCGSYSHSLKECLKPRDHVAVNNARKQQRSKRNQNAASRGATRYYQDLLPGKFDGLKPGALDSETRKILGLGELDPPPWLNRMRELGYPPGYLEADVDDQPPGIVIYSEEEDVKAGEEEGEISESKAGPSKKMAIQFPGINAPIPENADERRWTTRPLRSDSARPQSHDRTSSYPLPVDIPNVEGHRWSGYMRDDPLPGTEPLLSPQSPIRSSKRSWSPMASLNERGGRSHYEEISAYSYMSPGRYRDSVNEGRHGHMVEEGRRYHDRDYPAEGWRSSSLGYRSWR